MADWYRRLKPGSMGPGVCSECRLVKYTEIEAKVDAEKLRAQAEYGRAESFARAARCGSTGAWHIYIPTKGRAKTLRKRARRRDEKETTG